MSGLEVRTCAREEVGLSQLACGDGMTVRDAAAFAGVGMGAAKRWSAGDLPGSCTGRPRGSGRIWVDDARTTRGGARARKIEIKGLYEPPETGPLAEMISDQIEKLLLRAVLDDLKEGGSHPLSIPMRSRCGLAARCAGLGCRPPLTASATGHRRWSGRITICERTGLARSMSRKGASGDNARAEGFFGLLKQEFFYVADWDGASRDDFMRELDGWTRWFR